MKLGETRRLSRTLQRGGRHSKFTKVLQDTICQCLLQGDSIDEAIRKAGISRTSFWRYRKNPSFVLAIEEAERIYSKKSLERFMAEILAEKMRLYERPFLSWKRRRRSRKRLSAEERKRRLERPRDDRGRFCRVN